MLRGVLESPKRHGPEIPPDIGWRTFDRLDCADGAPVGDFCFIAAALRGGIYGGSGRVNGSLPVLAMSNVILDDIWLPDGRHYPKTLGGAAVFAAIAASLWWEPVALVAGVGGDFDDGVSAPLTWHGIRREGLIVRDVNTIQSTLVYYSDAERSETPVYGRDHFERMQLTPDHVPWGLLPAVGTYIFRDIWPEFWAAFRRTRHRLGTVLWELQADSAHASTFGTVASLFREVEFFSLNVAEASR
jgi:hypothetical protein